MRDHHPPCPCGCGELADECGRGIVAWLTDQSSESAEVVYGWRYPPASPTSTDPVPGAHAGAQPSQEDA